MWKPVLVAMAILAIAGSSIVFAQQRDGDHDGSARLEHRNPRFSPEDRAAFVDARIAALKAGLELTPDQAKNWPAFEQALRDMAQVRGQIRAVRDAHQQNPAPTTPFERMTQRADNMAKTSAALKRVADAGTPLYQTLDDAQKERFQKLARMLRPHHHHMHAWNGGVGRGSRD
ncbi:MAG: Spy/CpxP family protein refolding chaperone [Xanthobacteraceae bacterium]